MKHRFAICGARLTAAAIAASCGAAEHVLFDWEKAGDTAGWAEPAEKYRDPYCLLSVPRQTAEQAFTGTGALKIAMDTTTPAAAKSRLGRVDRYYGGKADWSGFKTLTAMCYASEGAPATKASLVIQSGDDWKWQQGEFFECPAGKWTRVSLDLAKIAHPERIQQLYLVVHCPSGVFQGALYLDAVALQEGGDGAAPGAEVVVAPAKQAPSAVLSGPAPTSPPESWIETFDDLAGWEKQGGASIEVSGVAAVGAGAVTFTLPGSGSKKIKSPSPRVPDALNEGFAGVSFWAKGDGSDAYGTVVLCGAHPQWFPFKYAYAFPLKATAWKQYIVPWQDWIPEDPVYAVGTPGGAPPSNVQHVKVGSKWTITHNNAKLPRHTYSLDQLQLEPDVPAVPAAPALASIDAVRAKLASKQPVQILCLGDSITAGTSLAKPDEERYAQVLERLLRQRCAYEGVSVQSRAVGGAQVNDLRLWAERDFTGIAPDLTIIMCGYNDKTWGYPQAYYAHALSDYIERVARQTQGRAAVLLLTPIPGRGARFVMMDDYAAAAREVAASRGAALCDTHVVFKRFGRDGLDALFADQAHPNAKGHALMASAIADAIIPAAVVGNR